MTIHELKIEPMYLKNLLEGKKRCEVRYNDRDYQVGDVLEFDDLTGIDAYQTFQFKVLHIHAGIGMREGYVVLSVVQIHEGTGEEKEHERD